MRRLGLSIAIATLTLGCSPATTPTPGASGSPAASASPSAAPAGVASQAPVGASAATSVVLKIDGAEIPSPPI